MGVVSMFFPLWVRQEVGAQRADATVGFVTASSMAAIFLLSPIIGSMTDRARRRLPFLTVSTACCIVFTLLMGRVGSVGTLVAFALANAFYQAGLQFYDALLPSVSTPATRGRIGGVGVGVGYVGSFFAIGLSLLGAKRGWPVAWLISCAAILFLAFAVPCFLWVNERENPAPGRVWSLTQTRQALVRTLATLRSANEHRGLTRFLIGRLFYTDPINTVIAIMTLYAINVAQTSGIGHADATKLASLVMFGAVVFAIFGGLGAGRLVDRYGSRWVLSWVLWSWALTFLLAAALGIFGLPWQLLMIVSALAGISLGATWSADRPLMLELTPPERLGEFYGLYGMVGRFAAVIGPLLWGISMSLGQNLLHDTLKSQGCSILILLTLIMISRSILGPVLKDSLPCSG